MTATTTPAQLVDIISDHTGRDMTEKGIRDTLRTLAKHGQISHERPWAPWKLSTLEVHTVLVHLRTVNR